MKFLLMFDSSVTLKCFLQYKINVVFLAEAFRIKESKLKNLVLFKSKNWIGEYLCQMSSCSKIVRKSDEVSHYIIWFDILYVVSVLLYHFPYIICLNKKYVAPKLSWRHLETDVMYHSNNTITSPCVSLIYLFLFNSNPFLMCAPLYLPFIYSMVFALIKRNPTG